MLAQEIGLQFHQTRAHAVLLNDTLHAECIEKAICMKTHVLFTEQNRNVNYKIYPNKKQNHLGKHEAMHGASGKPDATLEITEFQAYITLNSSTAG